LRVRIVGAVSTVLPIRKTAVVSFAANAKTEITCMKVKAGTVLAPPNMTSCFSGSVPRASSMKLQVNVFRLVQLKIGTANAALQTAPEQLVQGCHVRWDRADVSYG
jgi:hypothetical protein